MFTMSFVELLTQLEHITTMLKAHFGTRVYEVMPPPLVLVNTYVRANEKPCFIDRVSKIYIISGLFFGLNRLPLFPNLNIVFLMLSLLSTVLFASHYLYFFYGIVQIPHSSLVIGVHVTQWAFVVTFNLVSIKRLQRYYNELNEYDKEVGCSPKTGKASIRNLMTTFILLLLMMITFVMPEVTEGFLNLYLSALPIMLCVIQELHYYGHLLSLIIPRLRLINYYMELSLTNSEITTTLNIEEFGYLKADSNRSICEIEKMMNLYHNMIKAHNYLVEAVKWQLLVILISTFLVILMGTYDVSLNVIKGNITLLFFLSFLLLSGGLILSLFSPCSLGDQVHYEVIILRELLSSRIYENQMDKCSRGMALALLAWTETRDLSFSLLRMLDIDISLPFKFVGLLVTYLIILLQFQKIIDP